jgi:hypothetical protein
LHEHLAAGGDHVALQLITAPGADAWAQYEQLATALRG